MITVENLTKSFGDVKAVDNLSFEVKPGEIVGLLGPNGAGKTTTMRLMTGFICPDSGSVTIGGVSMGDNPTEVQRYIGYLPENNPLYRDMLVGEILEFSFALKKIPRKYKKEALDFVVSAVSIGDVFYRPIGELSKGYRQRVGMAVAMIHQPQILILDEPTEGLDPNQRTDIRSLIKKLGQNRTIILSTHVLQEAQAVCDRLLIINKGRLVASGTPDELSRLANKSDAIVVELEGEGVIERLKNLEGAASVDVESIGPNRYRARITGGGPSGIQPQISRLVKERGWVIWKLAQEEHKLEDIFHELTSSLEA